MEEIKRQVSRARRRMVLEQFLGIFGWCVFGALLLAAIGLAIPKFWPVGVNGDAWNWGWLGGALAAGLLATIVWTLMVRKDEMEAAVEIDRRFGLKERVSSSLALAPIDLESEAGRALLQDAERRVSRIEVREQFRVAPGLRPFLPLLPALMVFALFLVPNAAQDEAAAANSVNAAARQRVKTAVESIEERLKEKQKEAAESGLKKAEELMKQVSEGLEQIKSEENLDREKALIKLNDLSKELAKRQEQIGGSDKLRQELSNLKNMERGPADKVTKAIKEGDFEKAMEAMQELQDKLKKGELSEKEQQELAKQLQQMKDKLQEMADAHEQAKQELERQIQERKEKGDLAGAGQLQRKLDQLNSMNEQMAKMQQMADQMAQAAESLQNGQQQQAAEQLQAMADQLKEMQDQLNEMEMIEAAMDEIADCKAAMCEGDGGDLAFDMGMGQGMGQGDQPGQGLGEGQGQGDRPEEETDTASYRSRVEQNVQQGEAIRAGYANGPNMAGDSQESVKQEILSAKPEAADPVTNIRLPRAEREHSREYFQNFVDE